MSVAVEACPRFPLRVGRRWVGIVLSAALHAVVVLFLWGDVFPRSPPTEPEVVSVEVVAEPALVPEPPPPPQPPPPAEAPPAVAPPPPPPPPPLAKPQLEPGPLARHSDAASDAGARADDRPRQPAERDGAAPREDERKGGRRQVTQTERDMILAQVLKHWRAPDELRIPDAVITLSVQIRPDGTLGEPYHYQSPWNPAKAISRYAEMVPGSLEQRAVESLYRALRQAQPLHLPAAVLAKAPFEIQLGFRPIDTP